MAILLLFVSTLIGGLFTFGPARRPKLVLPGALGGTVLWLAASSGFTWLAESVIRLGAHYGPLATPAALMLWLWVSSFATLVGAEFNAVLLSELARSAGSTDRPPSAAASAPPGTPAGPPAPPPSSPSPS